MNGITAEAIKAMPTKVTATLTMVEMVGSPRQSPGPYPITGLS